MKMKIFLILIFIFVKFHQIYSTNNYSISSKFLKDINTKTLSSSPGSSIIIQNHETKPILLFSAYDNIHGRELWKTDGTKRGTKLVKDINPFIYKHDEIQIPSSSSPYFFTTINNNSTAIFSTGGELWETDGTEEGTKLIKDINSYIPSNFVIFNNLLYFIVQDRINGNKLWETDGTEFFIIFCL